MYINFHSPHNQTGHYRWGGAKEAKRRQTNALKSAMACPRSHSSSAVDKVPDILISSQRTWYFRPLRNTQVIEKPLGVSRQEREKGSGKNQENKGKERPREHTFFFFFFWQE